jgi:hypothetical protein
MTWPLAIEKTIKNQKRKAGILLVQKGFYDKPRKRTHGLRMRPGKQGRENHSKVTPEVGAHLT